ncbi:TPA: hypothetical protein K8M77_000292 [Clostridium perfringens]|nr:hypothetical protein [Clostridium perfringens]
MFKTLKKIRQKMIEASEKANAKADAIRNKATQKADKYIEEYLNSEGKKRATAKACLMQLTLAYNRYTVDYIGGSPYFPHQQENLELMIIPQGVVFKNGLDFLPFKDIKGISFKTHQQIEKDLTLTRMIAFGVYSLAMKKKRKVIHKYLIVECESEGMPYTMAFAGSGVEGMYQDMFIRMKNLKTV